MRKKSFPLQKNKEIEKKKNAAAGNPRAANYLRYTISGLLSGRLFFFLHPFDHTDIAVGTVLKGSVDPADGRGTCACRLLDLAVSLFIEEAA